uniref:Putative ovule protein n=1 Tax=Solanum chacoense TaxID=4108 RepID=A0A0V0HM15_SOLCH
MVRKFRTPNSKFLILIFPTQSKGETKPKKRNFVGQHTYKKGTCHCRRTYIEFSRCLRLINLVSKYIYNIEIKRYLYKYKINIEHPMNRLIGS